MSNLTSLFLDRSARRPEARFGVVEEPTTLAEAVSIARRGTGQLARAGVEAGSRAAIIGETGTSYLMAFLSLQLAGVEAALVNPALPDDLIQQMLDNLGVSTVLWIDRDPSPEVALEALHLDASEWARGRVLSDGGTLSGCGEEALEGLTRRPGDIAGYMHTSGTTGPPKFCALSHHYFLSLGRYIADSMAISPADTVFAPLSMFHINPLGYGVMGGLTGGADVLGTRRFSASRFWPTVRETGITVVFLHGPPVAILSKATSSEEAAGHQLRCVFLADGPFLEKFQVPMAYSGYGSTEAGGLTHIWPWHLGDRCEHPEGMSRYGGRVRKEVEWDLAEDGEILIRSTEDHVLSSGYQTGDGLIGLIGEDGWFHTGDLGRRDETGQMIFIERRSESIRVKGEFVPINYVERVFSEIETVGEIALWRRDGELRDDEVVLYVVSENRLPRQQILCRAEALAPFMRPAAVIRIDSMPRTEGAQKISRRELSGRKVLESFEMSGG